jgi:uracil-DNA glycosylase family protein
MHSRGYREPMADQGVTRKGEAMPKRRVASNTAVAPRDDAAPLVRSLSGLRKAENECRRCPLYRNATQAVPGEGPGHAKVMLVGEQPGDKEDLTGQPFVGPAGRILDKALADAGIPRSETFVTNAVKHFKFEPRGKRRLHKKPNAYEIERCKWWFAQERAIVQPELIVALGATAARSVMGRAVTIGKLRGQALSLDDGTRVVITIHPSALLRMPEEAERYAAYAAFVKDLKVAAKAVFGRRKKAA